MRRPSQSLVTASHKTPSHGTQVPVCMRNYENVFFLVFLHKFRFSGFHFKFSFTWCTHAILIDGESRQIFVLTKRGKLQEAHFVNFQNPGTVYIVSFICLQVVALSVACLAIHTSLWCSSSLSLFSDVTRLSLVVYYRRFGTAYRSTPHNIPSELTQANTKLINLMYDTVFSIISLGKLIIRLKCNMNNYTDIQPKISIDEISLLWLFCGC